MRASVAILGSRGGAETSAAAYGRGLSRLWEFSAHGGSAEYLDRFNPACCTAWQMGMNSSSRCRGGGQVPNVEGDFQRAWLAHGDQLLLCTDGLTDMVGNAAIAAVLGGATSAHAACQALVEAALKGGGKDNVTVALARYRFPT